MVTKITNGIQISVKTTYDGTIHRNDITYHAFSYYISIVNKSKDTVQLTERFWNIYDSLNDPDFVEGEGVVGQTPTLLPNDEYTYKSNCFLQSTAGSMKGFYKMINQENNDEFLVAIPTFQLTTTPQLN